MILTTRQDVQVLDELDRSGQYTVCEEYIYKKYTTITEHYAYLYRWLTENARAIVEIPQDSVYPVWLSPEGADPLPEAEGTALLTFDIPEGKYVIINHEAWGYMINHLYVPSDKEDELRHESELSRYGISSASSLISGNAGNFYPLLKQKVLKSWERVFTMIPEDVNEQAALCWQLKKEWLIR